MDNIKEVVASITDEIVAIRRDIHAHPELGFEEHRTAGLVEEYLQNQGIKTERVAGTGVVGVIEGGSSGPVLMLRADLDALPVEEANDVSYCSTSPGIMHACGHDAHTAILLGAAKILNEIKDQLSGSIKLVFQPNEENAGALHMIEEGVLDNPPVDAVMGLHLWTPLPSGKLGICEGAVMGGLDIFKIIVRGVGGHTGYPEAAVDPIIAAADIVQSAQRIQTREISLSKPTVIMFGLINGGTKANIIPDTVTLEGSIRTLYADSDKEDPMLRLKNLAEKVAAVHGCEAEVSWFRENIPLVNNSELVNIAKASASVVTGCESDVTGHFCMASEDFSEFSSRVPGVFIFLGTGNEKKESHYPHHNPRFNIDEDTIPPGIELYIRFAMRFFDEWEVKKRNQ